MTLDPRDEATALYEELRTDSPIDGVKRIAAALTRARKEG